MHPLNLAERGPTATRMSENHPPVIIRRVIERFPECTREVLRRFLTDDAFRALCEDYDLAAETLRRLETVERSRVESRIDEYRGVLDALEREIAIELSRVGEGRGR
jgi:hypothetical protein